MFKHTLIAGLAALTVTLPSPPDQPASAPLRADSEFPQSEIALAAGGRGYTRAPEASRSPMGLQRARPFAHQSSTMPCGLTSRALTGRSGSAVSP